MVIALFRMPYNLLTSLIPYVSHILIYIRQVLTVLFFYLYYLYCLSIFQRTNVASAAPAFFAKADAKIRTFSDNLQTFLKVFCFYFLNPLLFSRMSIIRLCLSSKAGAKVDTLYITSKYIQLFF